MGSLWEPGQPCLDAQGQLVAAVLIAVDYHRQGRGGAGYTGTARSVCVRFFSIQNSSLKGCLAVVAADSSRGVHHWSDEARGPSAAGTAAHPVPYPANATAMARSADGYLALVASLNSTSEGRQLIPLLPALPTTPLAAASAASVTSSTAALAGDYLLGYSHNPWGSSAAFRDVLQHHLGDG